MSKGKILIVDDEPHQRLIMTEACESLGYQALSIEDPQKALENLRYGDYDVLLTDLQMPGMDGIQLLEATKMRNSSISVIVVTAHGTVETAVDAMKKGAEDYIQKPVEFGALELTLNRVFSKRELVRENKKLMSENQALKKDIGIRYHLSNTIGRSKPALKLVEDIKKHMKSKSTLLVLGEPGVGKLDIARMIHYNSPWSNNDLIEFDCANVPTDLQEQHLFGEEKNDQTGTPFHPGLIEKAHMGTLVLSSVHKLDIKCHPRLLKVLKEERSQRVGGSKFYPAYSRIIATSTPDDLLRVYESGQFMPVVYNTFKANCMDVCSIRDRKEDIPILIAATAKRMAAHLGKEILNIDKSVTDRLSKYDFPGNIRELEAMVEAAVIRSNLGTLKIEHFGISGK